MGSSLRKPNQGPGKGKQTGEQEGAINSGRHPLYLGGTVDTSFIRMTTRVGGTSPIGETRELGIGEEEGVRKGLHHHNTIQQIKRRKNRELFSSFHTFIRRMKRQIPHICT
jgi:hypothetical protein